MQKIEIFRFFVIHTKPSEYILKKKSNLTKKARRLLKKYSDMKYYNEVCKRKDFIDYVIYIDGKYAGYLDIEPNRYYKQFYIYYVFLEEQFRGNGYSKLLFNYAVNDIKENFKNILTISAVPAFIEGKRFLESVGFIPDVFYHSSGGKGTYSIYYLYDKDIFLLDKEEYEHLCGDKYNYKVCGVKRYMELLEKERIKNPNFSVENYRYYLKHLKKPRKTPNRKNTNNEGLMNNLFQSSMDMDPGIDLFGEPEVIEEKVVPCMFTKEYLDTYMNYLD